MTLIHAHEEERNQTGFSIAEYLTPIQVLDRVIEMIKGRKLKIKEKDCWTADSMKMEELTGDAKAYNKSLDEVLTIIRRQKDLIK